MTIGPIIRFLLLVFIFYTQSNVDQIIEPYLPSNSTIMIECLLIALIYSKEAIRGNLQRYFNREVLLLVSFFFLSCLSLYINGNLSLGSESFRGHFVFIFTFLSIYSIIENIHMLRTTLVVIIFAYLTRIALSLTHFDSVDNYNMRMEFFT